MRGSCGRYPTVPDLRTEPAAGCLVPAARRVLERVGEEAHLGLLVCGGNATFADVALWVGAR